MDLLHLDFTKIEISSDCKKELKKKPEIVNVLVIMDHFTWHIMAFITEGHNCSKPWHMCCAIIISIYLVLHCAWPSPVRWSRNYATYLG